MTALEDARVGFSSGFSEEAILSSIHKFQKAKAYLSPYKGVYMPEAQLRNLIKEAGLEAVPRPKGIPENFRVKISDKGSGIIYVHPENENMQIRVMFGKAHSPNPAQREPYVIFQKDGKFFDKFGKETSRKAEEVHIPYKEFNMDYQK